MVLPLDLKLLMAHIYSLGFMDSNWFTCHFWLQRVTGSYFFSGFQYINISFDFILGAKQNVSPESWFVFGREPYSWSTIFIWIPYGHYGSQFITGFQQKIGS